jgi:hypothetical protein
LIEKKKIKKNKAQARPDKNKTHSKIPQKHPFSYQFSTVSRQKTAQIPLFSIKISPKNGYFECRKSRFGARETCESREKERKNAAFWRFRDRFRHFFDEICAEKPENEAGFNVRGPLFSAFFGFFWPISVRFGLLFAIISAFFGRFSMDFDGF